VKKEINRLLDAKFLGLVNILIGSLILCLLREKEQRNFVFASTLEILIKLLLNMNI
jgi:hypothetical protein